MQCNICGNSEFVSHRKLHNIKCSKCKSLARTRLLFMYICKALSVYEFNINILHISPEKGIYNALSKSTNNYIVGDINPDKYKYATDCKKLDLCDLELWRSKTFDLITKNKVAND